MGEASCYCCGTTCDDPVTIYICRACHESTKREAMRGVLHDRVLRRRRAFEGDAKPSIPLGPCPYSLGGTRESWCVVNLCPLREYYACSIKAANLKTKWIICSDQEALIPGSTTEVCSKCGRKVWISPANKELWKQVGGEPICVSCYLATTEKDKEGQGE